MAIMDLLKATTRGLTGIGLAGFDRQAAMFGQSIQSALTSSAAREAVYASNRLGPTMVPQIDMLLKAWWTDRASMNAVQNGLNEQGISWNPQSPPTGRYPRLWHNLIELSKPQWDLADYRRWFRQGRLTANQFENMMVRNGFIPKDAAREPQRENAVNFDLFAGDFDTPDFTLVIELWRRGLISKDDARKYLEVIGYTRTGEQELFFQLVQPVNLGEALVMRNRGIVNDNQLFELIGRLGYAVGDDAEKLMELRHEIPGASDLVRFAVREAFSPTIARRLGFMDEFPTAVGEWMEKQGYGRPFEVTDPTSGERFEMTWALAYWIASRQLPSPTQAYDFLHRFRGDPNDPATWRVPGVKPYLSDDLSALLKTADYPAPFRRWMEAASYRVLDKRDVNWALKFGIFDQAEAKEAYQDQGYNERDADRLARINTARFGGQDALSLDAFRRQTLQSLIKCQLDLYSVGGIAREEATANLTAMNVPELDATRRLDVIDICWRTAQLKLAVKAVKRAFLRGELDNATARMRLVQSGVTPRYVDAYLQRWAIEFTPRRRQLETGKLMDALARGYITQPDAVARLTRLGWTQPDQIILMADALRVFSEREAKAVAATERTRRAQAKEYERLSKEAEAQRKKFLAELNRIEPMAMLKRLAAKGEITRDQYEEALKVRGLPPSSIWRTLADTYGIVPKPVPPGGVQRGSNGSAPPVSPETESP